MTVPQIRNLVFEGGGVKGIAYVGALQVLRQRGYLDHVQRVGGTSAGAINALIFALGLSIREQLEILRSTDFSRFMDDSFGIIRDIRRLAKKFGWHRGEHFEGWLGELIEARLGSPDATFTDLADQYGIELYVVGSNLSTGYSEVFSKERHHDMPVLDAVRISMSIPLFFQAVRHGPRDDVYVDGGVQMNYPVKLFDRIRYVPEHEPAAARLTDYYEAENARFLLSRPDRSPYVYNRQTLGFRLDSGNDIALYRYDEPLKGSPIRNFTQYARALISAVMKVQENVHLHGDDWARTLYIDTLGVKGTDFDLDDDVKNALVEQGIKGATAYLKWFEDPGEAPPNRVA